MFKKYLGGSVAECRSLVAEMTFIGRSSAKRLDVWVVCDATGLASGEVSGIPMVSAIEGLDNEISLGQIYLFEQTTWEDLDCMVKRKFKKYVTGTWPYNKLGLSKKSISSYRLGSTVLRAIDDPFLPGFSPFQRVLDGPFQLRVFLKGAAQDGAIDALSFQTQITMEDISSHLQRILFKGRIIFIGPLDHSSERMQCVSMNFVAQRFAEYIAVRNNEPLHRVPSIISTFSSTGEPESPKRLREFIDEIALECKSRRMRSISPKPGPSTRIDTPVVKGIVPHVVVIENLHLITPKINDIIKGFSNFRNLTKEVAFVIGTFIEEAAPAQAKGTPTATPAATASATASTTASASKDKHKAAPGPGQYTLAASKTPMYPKPQNAQKLVSALKQPIYVYEAETSL